ncbi:MAG: vanadium-dependent haloperoxidase [Nocardioides sp.]
MHPRRTRTTLVLGGVCLAAGLALVSPSPGTARTPATAPDTYVSAWDATTAEAFTAAALTPAEGHLIYAYESIAVYDAVMAVSHRYRPFAIRANAPAGTSREAAAAAAAHRILTHYLPDQAPTVLDPALVSSLGTIPDGKAKADGIALGERVADAVIAIRRDDGFRAPVTYTPPDPPIPGVWLPTPATPTTPIVGPYAGLMLPFALRSADQFRPPPPPALSSRRWARDFNEVKELGSSTSATRTPDQTLAARFWAEPPVQQAHGALRLFVEDHGLDIDRAARFLAMTGVTYADSFIACFDAKYHYASWRPITAIRAGDTDGNDATVGDPAWATLLPATPNHPEYPSAHSCVTPAGALVMARFLGTRRIDLTIPSTTGLGDRHYATVGDLTREVTNARVWGGIHFRSAVEQGVVIARRTTTAVLAHHFR